MAKLQRKEAKIFAENCDNTLVTQFRTESADGSTASYSRDPDVIQNANYEQGWVEDTNNLNTKIYGEDMNAVGYVQSYLLKYLYENGIPEWSATTEYYEHSIARIDNRLFISLTDNNVNNDPTNTVGEWAEIPLSAINITTSGTGSSIFNSSTGNDITLKSLSVDGYASLQDNGDQINIHVLGGSGIVDAFWGQIQGTLTNQADLVSALGDKQDNLTFDSPLSVDVNNEVSIPKATDSINGYLDATDFQTFAGKQDALSGFTHSYDTDTDTAEIYPTANNSNLGTSSNSLSYTHTTNVGSPGGSFNKINFSNSNGGDITYDCGVSGDGNYGSHVFKVGAGQKLSIGGSASEFSSDVSVTGNTGVGGNLSVTGNTSITGTASITGTTSTDKIQGLTTATSLETGASIIPSADNTYNLGSSSNKSFANVYTRKVGSPGGVNNLISFGTTNGGDVTYDCGASGSGNYGSHILRVGAGDKLTVGGSDITSTVDILPSSDNTLSLGGTNKFKNLYVNNIMNGGGNSVNIAGATHKYLNGNTTHIYPTDKSHILTLSERDNTGNVNILNKGTVNISCGSDDADTGTNSGKIVLEVKTKNYGNCTCEVKYANIFGTLITAFFTQTIIPQSNNTYSIGHPNRTFNEVYTTNINGSAYSPSDRNKKDNIVERGTRKDAYSSLKAISNLKTYSYTFKDDDKKTPHIGVMAQDLREIDSSLVKNVAPEGSKEEDLYFELSGYCTLLTEAVQELSAKVNDLESRIKILEGNDKVEEK